MSGELATLLSGRYVELKMLPLSFKKYVNGTDKSKTILNKYNDYITFSSFGNRLGSTVFNFSYEHISR